MKRVKFLGRYHCEGCDNNYETVRALEAHEEQAHPYASTGFRLPVVVKTERKKVSAWRKTEPHGPALLRMLKRVINRMVPLSHACHGFLDGASRCDVCEAMALIRKMEPNFRKRRRSS